MLRLLMQHTGTGIELHRMAELCLIRLIKPLVARLVDRNLDLVGTHQRLAVRLGPGSQRLRLITHKPTQQALARCGKRIHRFKLGPGLKHPDRVIDLSGRVNLSLRARRVAGARDRHPRTSQQRQPQAHTKNRGRGKLLHDETPFVVFFPDRGLGERELPR